MLTCPNCGFGNAEGAKFCANCGTALDVARPIEGERRFASILFADVAHSTAIAEQLDPESWAEVMNGAFGFMNAAVARYGGTVSRLMGDAVLALFGAPVAHEDDAERAVRAGLDLQAAARDYAEGVKRRHGVDFDVRVGINTGTAVLAFVGDAVRSEYTAMGDVANVAARLQALAEPGQVLISADTYRLVRGAVEAVPRGPLPMKGKALPVETYEVTGLRTVPGQGRGVEGLTSDLVGRDREFDILKARLEDLGNGIGSVVAIVGEAGLGKSRLVAELRRLRGEAANPPAWFEARGISFGQAMPYYPWRQIGRQMLGAGDMDAADIVRDKLAEYSRRFARPESDLVFLETMMAVETERSRSAIGGLAGDGVVNGVANAVVGGIRATLNENGSTHPHVLVMDDLHWSDSATLELVAQVATLALSEPLMFVCVMRPDRRAASWGLLDRLEASLPGTFSRLDLEPLDSAAASQLLGNLLHIEDLPPAIREQIVQRSEGNPFYLEEVLRSLIDMGQVVREGAHWRATSDIIDAHIPETLAGVLSARIDRLPEPTKRVAQTAAVIGRVFQQRVLETVCRAAPAAERIEHVEPHIATLSFEQLVRERARLPDREYIFKHALTCEAAYELLLRSRRRELHGRAGAALEALYADRADEFAPLLAHHFAEAEDLPRAVAYSGRAADTALRLYATHEEVQHRDRVMALYDRIADAAPADVIDATLAWVVVRHRTNRYDEVLDRLGKAVELARGAGDERRLARALSWTGNIHMVTGFPSRSAPYLQESRDLAEKLGEENLLMLPLFLATWTLVDRDPGEAVGALDKVIAMAREQQVMDVLGHAMGFRAVALARLGRKDEALAQIEEALRMAPHAGSPVKEADVHISVGEAYYDLGDLEAGLAHSRIGGDLANGVHGIECACAGYFGVGRGELLRAHPDDALREFARSLEMARQLSWGTYINQIEGAVGLAEFEKGAEAGIEALRGAAANAARLNDEFGAATLSQELAGALLRVDHLDEASAALADAMAYYRPRQMRPYLARALNIEAGIAERRGNVEAAAAARAEAARFWSTATPAATDS